jgi:hypothetical protein
MVKARLRSCAGLKGELLRAQVSAFYTGPTHIRRRTNGGEMLRPEPGRCPPGADALDAHSPPGDRGQGKRSAQDLATSFTIRPIQEQHPGKPVP